MSTARFLGEVVGGVVGETALFFSKILSPEQLQEPLTGENEQTLPDGWEAIVDPGSGLSYYNSNIDETSCRRDRCPALYQLMRQHRKRFTG
jgi:hypothetical protein